MNKVIALITVLFSFNAWSAAQPDSNFHPLWSATHAGQAGDSEALKVATAPSGNIYVAGYTTNTIGGTSTQQILEVRKYAPDGTPVWTYSPTAELLFQSVGSHGYPVELALGPNETVHVAVKYNLNDRYLFLLLDANGGKIKLEDTFAFSASPVAIQGMGVDAAGNTAVAIRVGAEKRTVRYGTDGTILWNKLVDSSAAPNGSVAVNPAGEAFRLWGQTEAGGDTRIVVSKYDTSGNVVWNANYFTDATDNLIPYEIVVDTAGRVVVLGTIKDAEGDQGLLLYKLDPATGDKTYEVRRKFAFNQAARVEEWFPTDMSPTPDGMVAITCQMTMQGIRYGVMAQLHSMGALNPDVFYPNAEYRAAAGDSRQVTFAATSNTGPVSGNLDFQLRRGGMNGTIYEGQFSVNGSANTTDFGYDVAIDPNTDDPVMVGSLRSSNGRLEWYVQRVLQKPTAYPDSFFFCTFQNTPLEVSAENSFFVRSPGSKGGAVVLVTPTTGGDLELNTDGSFRYTPNATFCGVDSFVYRIDKAGFSSETREIRIGVEPGIKALEIPDRVPGGLVVNGILRMNGTEPDSSHTTLVFTTSSDPAVMSPQAPQFMPFAEVNDFFRFNTSQVTVDTPVTITCTRGPSSVTKNVIVEPGALSTFTISPNSVQGGDPTTGTVTLVNPAGASGRVVTLTANSSVVIPPASVTVPAGATTHSFVINTMPVTAVSSRTISANVGPTTKTVGISLQISAKLSTLTLAPTTVHGGEKVTGTVTLDRAAGHVGASIALSDDTSSMSTPANVVIPTGGTTGTFTIATFNVGTMATRNVRASYRGVTKSATVTLVPTPPLSSLTLSTPNIVGGNSLTANVALSSAPTAGSVTVSMSDDTSSITTPATAVISVNTTSRTVLLSTSIVSTTATRNVRATLNGLTRSASLTLHPRPSLTGLTISPTAVNGGSSATGTVTVSPAVQGGGISISLSDNSSAANTPVSTTISAPNASRSFTITTIAVSATTTVTVAAAYNGGTRSATLSVRPVPALSSLSVSPTTIQGGSSSTGTVRLASTTASSLTVSLSDNSTAATTPASTVVLANSSARSFTITTPTRSTTATVTITASLNGVTRTAVLTVTPTS